TPTPNTGTLTSCILCRPRGSCVPAASYCIPPGERASRSGSRKRMYAIVETGGKQYRVKPGDTVAVERLAGEPGESLDLGRVLLVAGNGDQARIGSPGV